MQKIASPQDLQAELRSIMAFIHGHGSEGKPDRQIIASKLRDLADRLANRNVKAREYTYTISFTFQDDLDSGDLRAFKDAVYEALEAHQGKLRGRERMVVDSLFAYEAERYRYANNRVAARVSQQLLERAYTVFGKLAEKTNWRTASWKQTWVDDVAKLARPGELPEGGGQGLYDFFNDLWGMMPPLDRLATGRNVRRKLERQHPGEDVFDQWVGTLESIGYGRGVRGEVYDWFADWWDETG